MNEEQEKQLVLKNLAVDPCSECYRRLMRSIQPPSIQENRIGDQCPKCEKTLAERFRTALKRYGKMANNC